MSHRRFSAVILSLLFCVPLTVAQEKPFWVETGTIPHSNEFYFGIGSSSISPQEADAQARREFSLSVEVKVNSILQQEIKEDGEKYSAATSMKFEEVSDVSLRGITITERYVDTLQRVFFSLISVRKDDYVSLMKHEIEQELQLVKAKNRAEEEKRQEELRSRQVDLLLQEQEEEHRRLKLAFYKKQYGDFLEQKPPEKVIHLRNGEITSGSNALAVRLGISPIEVEGIYVCQRIWKFELSGYAEMRAKEIQREEAHFKIQVIPNSGEYIKTSLSLGAVGYLGTKPKNAASYQKAKYSFFISGNVTVPVLAYSYFSFYGDSRIYSIGVTNFALFKTFHEHVGFVLESSYITDRQFRNKYDDPFMIQGGFRFQANEKFSSLLAYENHEEIILTLEFEI